MATQSSPFKFNNDLLVLIMKQVDDTETLTALSLCSKTFHSLVEPMLYSVINLVREEGAHEGQGLARKFAKFLRSILQTPALGIRVKTVDSAVDYITGSFTIEDEFTNNDCERLKSAIERTLGPGHTESAYDEAVNQELWQNWDILFTVLLCHLPNVEVLNLRLFDSLSKYLEMVLGRAADLQRIYQTRRDSGHIIDSQISPEHLYGSDSTDRSDVKLMCLAFQKLSQVDLDGNPWTSGYVDIMHTLPVLSLPSLKFLAVYLDSYEAETCDFDLTISQDHRTSLYKFPYPQFSFDLTSLTIEMSSMPNSSLTRYLPMFRCLTHFAFSRDHEADEWAEPQQILNSLARSSESLEHIYIWDCKSPLTPVGPEDDNEFGGPISSLVSFPKLKDVGADYWMLVGQGKYAIGSFLHAFPKSLESLTMRGYSCQSLNALTRLLKERLPPRLLNVVILCFGRHPAQDMTFQEACTALEEQATQVGMALSIS